MFKGTGGGGYQENLQRACQGFAGMSVDDLLHNLRENVDPYLNQDQRGNQRAVELQDHKLDHQSYAYGTARNLAMYSSRSGILSYQVLARDLSQNERASILRSQTSTIASVFDSYEESIALKVRQSDEVRRPQPYRQQASFHPEGTLQRNISLNFA